MGFLRISVFRFPTSFLVTREWETKTLEESKSYPASLNHGRQFFIGKCRSLKVVTLTTLESPYCIWDSHGFSSFSGFVTRNLRFRSPRIVHRMGLFLRYCSRNTCNIRLWNRVDPETEAQESLEPPNCLSPPFCTDLAWLEWAAGSTTCMPLITSLLNLFSQFS